MINVQSSAKREDLVYTLSSQEVNVLKPIEELALIESVIAKEENFVLVGCNSLAEVKTFVGDEMRDVPF